MTDMQISGTAGYNLILNSVKEHTQPKHADAPIDVDTVELSGVSQAAVGAVKAGGKAVYIDDENYDDLFRAVDIALEEQKRQTQEYTEYLKKYREEQDRKRHIQQQKALEKAELIKKTGYVWTSELSAEAKQIVMSSSPQALADYKEEKEIDKEYREKRSQQQISG